MLPCSCAIAAQLRVLKQNKPCPCCVDGRKSAQTREMTAAIKDLVDALSASRCMFMVEFPMEKGKGSPRRADIFIVPVRACKWEQTLVIEVDPPSHFYNADARSALGNLCSKYSLDEKRDVLLDADERKDALYNDLGVQHLRVSVGRVWDEQAWQHVAAAVHARMQAAGI